MAEISISENALFYDDAVTPRQREPCRSRITHLSYCYFSRQYSGSATQISPPRLSISNAKGWEYTKHDCNNKASRSIE